MAVSWFNFSRQRLISSNRNHKLSTANNLSDCFPLKLQNWIWVHSSLQIRVSKFAAFISTPRPQETLIVLRDTEGPPNAHVYNISVNHDSWFVESSKYSCAPKEKHALLIHCCSVMIATNFDDLTDVDFEWGWCLLYLISGAKLSELVISKTDHIAVLSKNLTMDETATNLHRLLHQYFLGLRLVVARLVTQLAVVICSYRKDLSVIS